MSAIDWQGEFAKELHGATDLLQRLLELTIYCDIICPCPYLLPLLLITPLSTHTLFQSLFPVPNPFQRPHGSE